MDMFEFNKIVGAILFSMLIIFAIGELTGISVRPNTPEKLAFPITIAVPTAVAKTEETAEAAPSLGGLLAAADIEKRRKFSNRCGACHTFDEGGSKKIGPNLWGILGNDRAQTAGFAYSPAMAGLGGAWGYDELNAFLTNPKAYAPGNKMAFVGVKKPTDRANLILYLRSLGDQGMALPPGE